MESVYKIPNLRIFTAHFLGPTNTLGSRVKITELNRGQGFNQSITLGYDYQIGSVNEQAFNYLKNRGYNVVGRGNSRDHFYFFCDNWAEDYIELKPKNS